METSGKKEKSEEDENHENEGKLLDVKRIESKNNYPGTSSSDSSDISVKCKELIKNLIKTFYAKAKTASKHKSVANKSKQKLTKESVNNFFCKSSIFNNSDKVKSLSDLEFSPNERFKEYESWEAMMQEVDRNIVENVTLRFKYDAERPFKVSPPSQKYFYVEGFGVFSEKYLPDLKELEASDRMVKSKIGKKL